MPAEHLSKRIGEHPSTFFPPPVTSNSPQLPLTAVQSRSRASHLKYSVANTVSTPPQRLRRLSCSQISAFQRFHLTLSRRSRVARGGLATRHSPLATRHSPLATRHSPLATRHSPLASSSARQLVSSSARQLVSSSACQLVSLSACQLVSLSACQLVTP